jgi:hypothetical protein
MGKAFEAKLWRDSAKGQMGYESKGIVYRVTKYES